MRLGVHVLTYNRPLELYGLLTGLLGQTHKDFDLILVDSSDQKIAGLPSIAKTLTQLKLQGHGVEYVPLDYRPSIGEARNIAINRDDNEVCVRIDDDSYLDEQYLFRLADTYLGMPNTRGYEGVKVGAVGGVVPLFGSPLIYGQPAKFETQPFNEITFHSDRITVADDGGMEYWGMEDQSACKAWKSHHLRSSFLFSKQAVKEAGMHALEYGFTGFREETDLCMRLVMKGYKLFTNPSAIAYHVRAETGGARIQGYEQQVALCEQAFQRKFLRYRRQGLVKDGMFTTKEGLQ